MKINTKVTGTLCCLILPLKLNQRKEIKHLSTRLKFKIDKIMITMNSLSKYIWNCMLDSPAKVHWKLNYIQNINSNVLQQWRCPKICFRTSLFINRQPKCNSKLTKKWYNQVGKHISNRMLDSVAEVHRNLNEQIKHKLRCFSATIFAQLLQRSKIHSTIM